MVSAAIAGSAMPIDVWQRRRNVIGAGSYTIAVHRRRVRVASATASARAGAIANASENASASASTNAKTSASASASASACAGGSSARDT